jgi:hypothetical protein
VLEDVQNGMQFDYALPLFLLMLVVDVAESLVCRTELHLSRRLGRLGIHAEKLTLRTNLFV